LTHISPQCASTIILESKRRMPFIDQAKVVLPAGELFPIGCNPASVESLGAGDDPGAGVMKDATPDLFLS